MSIVLRGFDQHLVCHLVVDLGNPGADHVWCTGLRARVHGVLLAQPARQFDLCLVRVRDDDAVEATPFVDHLDSAPVGYVADRKRREPVERRLGVEGAG